MWVGFMKGRIKFSRLLSLRCSNLARLLAFSRFRIKCLCHRSRPALSGQSSDFNDPVRFITFDVQLIPHAQDLGWFTAVLAIDPNFSLR